MFYYFCPFLVSYRVRGKKDFKDGIVQLQSRPVSLSLDKMRCMWNGKDTVVSEGRYDTGFF